ncbi:MAG TPA: hypothetical protein VEH84_03325 [Alphaproteobacteria bacterium]|nr:hypothetical protein [Alphaproteobacteria bacterium]
MPLKTIRLELARNRGMPEGRSDHGYEFVAPLTPDGHFDAEAWKSVKDKCTVRRFAPNEGVEEGRLVHRRGQQWMFDYDGEAGDDDEPIFRFASHRFVEGEYLSIVEHDGAERTFRVASVTDVGPRFHAPRP